MTHDSDQTVDAEVEDLDMVFMRAVALALPAYELYNGRESAAIPDVAVVAVAFLREALAPPTRPALNKCSWCVQAAGDTEEAWQAARSYSIEEVRAHALTCVHNPLVEQISQMTRARDAATCEVTRLTEALEERRADGARAWGRVSDIEMSLATTALAHDVMERQRDEARTQISEARAAIVEARAAMVEARSGSGAIVLPAEDFDRLTEMLENPPEPTEALRRLMAETAPTSARPPLDPAHVPGLRMVQATIRTLAALADPPAHGAPEHPARGEGRVTALRAYYFGCWQRPGHGLFHVGGRSVRHEDGVPFDVFDNAPWLDGGLAPRKAGPLLAGRYGIDAGQTCCALLGITADGRRFIRDRSVEVPQGRFLLHWLRGYTLLAWWDRTQGDDRGACNSVFIVEGEHTATEMLTLWPELFPLQAANLARAGVELREVGAHG